MKLHGVLNFFDEAPSWLAACLASMSKVCDHVVVVDGRYALFDHEMVVSPTDQAETIVETCEGAGLPLTLYRPAAPFFGNEIEKRSLSLRLALASAEPMVDWLLVIDADCYVTEYSDLLKYDLERCVEHCATINAEEHLDPLDPAAPLAVAHTVSLAETWRSPVTLLYRCLPDLRYEGTHYSLSGTVGGEKVWLWGHDRAEQPFDARHALTVRHRNVLRPVRRREQASTYYARRDKLGIEERPR